MMALAVPLMLRWVRPNPWYGFRVPATLSNEKLWYEANAYTGRYLFAVGAIGLIAAIGLAYVPGLTENTYAWAFLILFGVALAVMVILSFRYLRRLEAL